MTLTVRSGCAGAGGPRKKKLQSHFAAAGLARGLRLELITHTSQRLCRRRGAKTKTWHSHYAAVAPAQGAREKKETTLTLHSGCDGAGGVGKQRWQSHFAATVPSQGRWEKRDDSHFAGAMPAQEGEKSRGDNHTLQRLCRRRGRA